MSHTILQSDIPGKLKDSPHLKDIAIHARQSAKVTRIFNRDVTLTD